MTFPVRIDRKVWVPMDDGTRIALTLYLPCDGNLRMWGISWGGFSALQTAMLQPPQLKAIVAMHATHDRFACDVHYTGGSAHAAEQLDWPGSMITTNALPPDSEIFEAHGGKIALGPPQPFPGSTRPKPRQTSSDRALAFIPMPPRFSCPGSAS